VPGNPGGILLWSDLACGNADNKVEAVVLSEVVYVAVDPKHPNRKEPCGSFVAVDQRVKARSRIEQYGDLQGMPGYASVTMMVVAGRTRADANSPTSPM